MVWVVIAVIVGFIVVTLWPPKNPSLGVEWLPLPSVPARITFGFGVYWHRAGRVIGVGLGLAWWNLPGTVLGFFAGFHLSRKSWLDFILGPPE
jgi:hypothetical protein